MDEMIVGTITDMPAESNHPVLQQLKDKIAELEAKVAKGLELDSERIQTINRLRNEKWQYETKVKNVLTEAWEDYDQDTIKHIAEQLDITLTLTKQYEVNVTFTIDVEHEMDETVDPEWEFDFSVSSSVIQDYSADIIWSKEIS